MLYFDHAASTPLREGALAVLNNSLVNDFANPSAGHKLGKDLMERLEKSRQTILNKFSPGFDLIFTASATESNNIAVNSIKDRDGVVFYMKSDHPSLCRAVENFCPKYVDISGKDIDSVISKLDGQKIAGLCIGHVDGQSGQIHPIDELAKKVRKHSPDVYVHIDGAQAFGKIPLEIDSINVDSYAISGHKFGAPKGIGGLFFNEKGESLKELFFGGRQERGVRSSTIAAPLVFSFETAIHELFENFLSENNQLHHLNKYFVSRLKEAVPSVEFPFEGKECSPHIILVKLKNIPSDIVMRQLEMKNIFVSSSSACSAKIKGVNPGFLALGIPENFHKNLLRISFSPKMTESELDTLISELQTSIEELDLFRNM